MLANKKKWMAVILTVLLAACTTATEETQTHAQTGPNPRAAQYNLQLGLGYLEQGQRQKAKQKLLTAIKQSPRSAEVNGGLAYYYEAVGDTDTAERYYKQAISFAPADGAQLNNYGAFLCRQRRYSESEEYFLKAVRDKNYLNIAGAYENAGICASRIPDMAKAQYYFQKANDYDPTKGSALLELSQAELEQREVKV